MASIDCGHAFCVECWDAYLSVKVMEEGQGHTIECPMVKCNIIVDDQLAVRLIKNDSVKRRYQQLMTKSFVDCNRLMRYCPAPNCCNTIKAEHYAARPVQCKCGNIFCFACGSEWHEPISCRLLSLWARKCSDDSETSNWIAANTKVCAAHYHEDEQHTLQRTFVSCRNAPSAT